MIPFPEVSLHALCSPDAELDSSGFQPHTYTVYATPRLCNQLPIVSKPSSQPPEARSFFICHPCLPALLSKTPPRGAHLCPIQTCASHAPSPPGTVLSP